ncbi:MAG: hypothetical protein LUE93_04725, partial [Bacteroides sp.]|nr:hypothetical protein [Bacteroides sp.]
SEPYVDYNLYLKEELIYTGRVYFKSEEENSIRIDISDICREYLETFYEHIERASTTSATSVPESGKLTTIGIFDVNSTGGNGSYPVIYDYNTDYESDLPNSGSLNDPILEEADPRQMIYISGYNYSGTTSFSYSIEEGSSGSNSLTSNLFNLYQINLDNLTAPVGSTLTTTCNGTEHTYKIVPSCKNRFVLYYVNKYGGLDSLLCGGRSIESFNAQQTDIHIYPDKSDSRNWGEKRVHQEIEKQYQLNTK